MKSKGTGVLTLVAMVGLAVVVGLSLALGQRRVPLDLVFDVLMGQGQGLDAMVVRERIPRTIFGILAGAALGVSGALLQSLTRNPLADPGILGINGGASLMVVMGIAWWGIGSPLEYLMLALLGAGLSLVLVFALGSQGSGGPTPLKLALSGSIVTAITSSLISAILLPRTDVLSVFRFWQVGSLGGASFEGMLIILPLLILGFGLAWGLSPQLDTMALGEAAATGLGVRPGLVRGLTLLASVLLCGATTSLAGPLGFIGLMVPHGVRMLHGPSMVSLVPLSALGGAMVLVLADVLGRFIGPGAGLEAGIVTAIIGAPLVIVLASKTRVVQP